MAQHSSREALLARSALGHFPGIRRVVTDGRVKCRRSRNTPPATRIATIIKG